MTWLAIPVYAAAAAGIWLLLRPRRSPAMRAATRSEDEAMARARTVLRKTP